MYGVDIVFGRMTRDGYFIARLQRRGVPSFLRHYAWAREFALPILNHAFVIGHIELDYAMGIDEVKVRHGAGQGNFPGSIEFRPSMMSRDRKDEEQDR